MLVWVCLQGCVTHVCSAARLQIGYRHVVDATLQEEACSLASMLVSVTSQGVVTCMRKVGKGSLDPESIFEMMEVRFWFCGRCWALLGVPAASCHLDKTIGISHLHPEPRLGAWRTAGASWMSADLDKDGG